jgi:hypothetical protein
MSLEEVIAESIDVPNQDTKNVAAIIADYAKYNILNQLEIRCVNIYIYSDVYEPDDYLFVYDGEYYYVLNDSNAIKFINGIPSTTCEHKKPIKPMVENPEKYVFIEGFHGVSSWKLYKKYNTYKEFYKVYEIHILKWYKLLNTNSELLGDRIVSIYYMHTQIYNCVDDDDNGFNKLSENVKDSILRLFDDDDD